MSKKIFISSICALVALAACERVAPENIEAEGEGLRITVDCNELVTKATRDGVGNENRIRTIDYFLFSPDFDTYRYKGRITPDANSNFTFYVQSALLNESTYTVFTIVNYPGAESDLGVNGTSNVDSEKRTMAQLRALLLDESTVRTFSTVGRTPAEDKDLSLVMTGSADVTIHATGTSALVGTANISLKRLAAKVTMDFYIADSVERTIGSVTETWEPLTDGNNIRVYLCNGTESVYLGGTSPASYDLFDYLPNMDNTPIPGKAGYETAFSSATFYTYPETWTYGSTEEPYLKLILPWKLTRSTGSITSNSQKEFYYKVMLPTNKFESNYWYNLVLDVTQLGSANEDDAVNIKCGYQVADWGTQQIVVSTLAQGYYLDVNESHLINKFYSNDLDVPFFASGSVTLQNVTIQKTDFTTSAVTPVTNSGYVALGDDYVAIRHPLDTDYSGTTYDVSPYVFTFTLHLDAAGTDTSYDKTVTVTQYPPLYIAQVLSDGYVSINSYSYAANGQNRLYDNTAAVSATLNATTAPHYLGCIVDPSGVNGSGDNNNQYIFEVEATIIDMEMEIDGETKKIVIGDPRSKTPTDFGGDFTGLTSASYYPTAEDTKNVISPRFRIASSYGKTYTVSYEGAQRRCAAYQENGYPAGRWRLPTMAEIEFLIKLSDNGKIKTLFGASTTNAYWAGGNEARFSDQFRDLTGSSSSASGNAVTVGGYNVYTRCVYDTWYWGTDQHADYTSQQWLGFKTTL